MFGDIEITIGCILVGTSLASITGLVIWSRLIIEYVADSEQQTARQLLKGLNGEQ